MMNKNAQVEIESMAFKGYGVARPGGKVLFVPHTMRGDRAWVEIVEEKKSYSFGRLRKLTTPSPWRIDPPCPYFGRCGGCQWQSIDYSAQGELKKEILQEILKRLGGLKEIPLITVLPSLDPYGYRVRVQLKVREKGMGYYEERSHHVVDIDHCLISHPLVNQMILSLRRELLFFRMEEIGINVSPDEGKGIFILHPRSLPGGWEDFLEEFIRTCSIHKGCVIARRNGLTLIGDPFLSFDIPGNRFRERRRLRLRTSPLSFFQVNLRQNEKLIRTVLEFSDVKKDERVLDLYAGIGNFTLPLATQAKEVVGIEESGPAVEDGRFNIEENGIKNCDFRQGRVEDLLDHWGTPRPDLIVLDPPRTGCKKITNQIAGLKPRKIVYISCEPTTFARDLRLFSERGYHLQRLTLIDMFPQTYHMEVVGLLQRG
ncbi:MAG: 23S rRNA (uracil(1939)-C(5))-methyltransferase RlmD [Thermodesulfobacteriota bacterium]|jgi:23S rRNA (uracil1939-C5)-methyltransferase